MTKRSQLKSRISWTNYKERWFCLTRKIMLDFSTDAFSFFLLNVGSLISVDPYHLPRLSRPHGIEPEGRTYVSEATATKSDP